MGQGPSNINLKGVMQVMRAAMGPMIAAGIGYLINLYRRVPPITAKRAGPPTAPARRALYMLTAVADRENRGKGLRILGTVARHRRHDNAGAKSSSRRRPRLPS